MCGVTTNIEHTPAPMKANEDAKTLLGSAVAVEIDKAVKTGIWIKVPTTYAQLHAMEVKAVLDLEHLEPVASEFTFEIVIGYDCIRRTARGDLMCKDVQGDLVLLDVKTHTIITDADRAQISLYYNALRTRKPVTRCGLLIVPTAGTHLGGYIQWISPMSTEEAVRILEIIPEEGG